VAGPQAGEKLRVDMETPVTLWEQVGFQTQPPVLMLPTRLTPEVS